MKKLILAALLSLVGVHVDAPLAHCVWCSQVPCYGPCAGNTCKCLRRKSPGPGECVSLEAIPELKAHGYTEWDTK